MANDRFVERTAAALDGATADEALGQAEAFVAAVKGKLLLPGGAYESERLAGRAADALREHLEQVGPDGATPELRDATDALAQAASTFDILSGDRPLDGPASGLLRACAGATHLNAPWMLERDGRDLLVAAEAARGAAPEPDAGVDELLASLFGPDEALDEGTGADLDVEAGGVRPSAFQVDDLPSRPGEDLPPEWGKGHGPADLPGELPGDDLPDEGTDLGRGV